MVVYTGMVDRILTIMTWCSRDVGVLKMESWKVAHDKHLVIPGDTNLAAPAVVRKAQTGHTKAGNHMYRV